MRKVISRFILFAVALLAPSSVTAGAIAPTARADNGAQVHRAIRPAADYVALRLASGSDEAIARVPIASGKSVEILRGTPALGHLKNLHARRPDVFQKTTAALRARGWTPTETVIVMRTVRDTLARNQNGVLPAQSIYTSDGEVVFWSWDDGDNSTWEGQMYAVRYADGAEVVTNAQADTVTNEITWEDLAYHQPGELSVLQYVQETSDHPVTVLASLTSSQFHVILATPPFPTRQFIKDWVACVVQGCAAAAAGCVFSGPAYPECFALGCATAVTACAIATIIQYL